MTLTDLLRYYVHCWWWGRNLGWPGPWGKLHLARLARISQQVGQAGIRVHHLSYLYCRHSQGILYQRSGGEGDREGEWVMVLVIWGGVEIVESISMSEVEVLCWSVGVIGSWKVTDFV